MFWEVVGYGAVRGFIGFLWSGMDGEEGFVSSWMY
jgi:hypothetical protein